MNVFSNPENVVCRRRKNYYGSDGCYRIPQDFLFNACGYKRRDSVRPFHSLMTPGSKIIPSIIVVFFIASLMSDLSASFGGRLGVSLQWGTHIQRVGVMYQIYCFKGFVQFNQGSKIHFNRRAPGPEKRGFEMQTFAGIQFYGGAVSKKRKYFFNEYSLMSEEKYALGYTFRFYLDQIGTSQATGALFFNIDCFGLILENDLFGIYNSWHDKFRTGVLALTCYADSIQFALQTTHWTGKAFDGVRFDNPDYPAKHGYRDLSGAKHGKYSHGILALRADFILKYNQVFRIESGIDAEQIRHAVQNRLVHDFLIAPGLANKGNPHYPMLQEDGMPYLYGKGQKIRKPKWFFQTGLNPGFSY